MVPLLNLTRSPRTTSNWFSVVTVNGEHRKPEFKIKRRSFFLILPSQDGLKAPLQKESPNQLLPKDSSEAGVGRCSSK